MNRVLPIFQIFAVVSFCSFLSCSSSSGVDSFYTFNLLKPGSFTVTPQDQVGQDVSVPFQIPIDSADFINGSLSTSLSKIESVKLTKLTFTIADASFPMTNFDSVRLFVSADSLADRLLGGYVGAADSIYLTNADFAQYLKKSSVHYSMSFHSKKAPAQDVNITTGSTLVLSAAPVQ